MEPVTIRTKTAEGDDRNVTLWPNKDGTISLLGVLPHGTQIIVDQQLIDDLQGLIYPSIPVFEYDDPEML